MKYGPANPSCKDLSLQIKGHLINSNYVSVELNLNNDDRSEICFSVVVSNGIKTISIEGTHLFGKRICQLINFKPVLNYCCLPTASTISSVTLMAAASVTMCTLVVCLSLMCVILIYHHLRRTMIMRMDSNNGKN